MSMNAPTNTSPEGAQNAFSWIVSWLAIILVLVALSSVQWGKRIVYYVAWLSVILLIVTHSSEFSSLFGQFNQDTISAGSASTGNPPGNVPPSA